MSALEQLLIIQEHDTAAEQLRHRRDHLPEREALASLSAARADVAAQRHSIEEERAGLSREQKRLEDEIASIESKHADTDRTLYSGSVTSPRELQGLQEELGALARRQEVLEDELLEVLTAIEPLDERLAALDAERERIDTEEDTIGAALVEAERDIDADIERVATERAAAAATVPADQLAHYESIRPQLGGIAVARLIGTSCGGCHLMLSAVEIARIRKLPPDEPAICEECGRMLVH
ncbi:MAG: hypothetical protein JJE52_11795 [Acidimicrobiia bacterium]|nr:hypothetical protein [Acidimicrobiia bacterium]